MNAPLPIAADGATALSVLTVRPDRLEPALDALPPSAAAFVRSSGFKAAAQELCLVPGPDGISAALLGLGDAPDAYVSPWSFGGLAFRLPSGSIWRIEAASGQVETPDAMSSALGFLLGAYRAPGGGGASARLPASLAGPVPARARILAESAWMARDLINRPANDLGPAQLADAVLELAAAHGAKPMRVEGAELASSYPTVAAVGAGSDRAPVVAGFAWHGSSAGDDAPLVWLCGKGVCFDTGGYDLKPSSAMLRMKKDMGGAAVMLALARSIMALDLPIRLVVRVGCVENSVSGHAMRPLDVIRTRAGLTVEIGNTDAEGRLVLADLLAEASEAAPALIVDAATLTGAARVALGPDLPALFCDDDALAEALLRSGTDSHDPLWRLPMWKAYQPWLESISADVNNVSSKPHAGAIVAALFLKRFVTPSLKWAHIDVYAWNDTTAPGRPEGGEAQSFRALLSCIESSMFR